MAKDDPFTLSPVDMAKPAAEDEFTLKPSDMARPPKPKTPPAEPAPSLISPETDKLLAGVQRSAGPGFAPAISIGRFLLKKPSAITETQTYKSLVPMISQAAGVTERATETALESVPGVRGTAYGEYLKSGTVPPSDAELREAAGNIALLSGGPGSVARGTGLGIARSPLAGRPGSQMAQ